MAIAIVGTPAYQHYDSFVENAHTLSVTVPSGAEVLLIGVQINNDVWSQLTSLTFNGASVGTNVGTTPNSVANRSCRWYAVVSPSAGTFNIVATYSTSSNNKGGMLAVCLTGVDTGSLIADAQASSTGSGSSPLSTSVTSPSGAVAFAACYADTQQPTPSAGQTALGTTEQNHCFSYKLNATAMGVTFSGAPQIAQSVIVVRAAPSSAFSGAVTLDDAAPSGTFSTVPNSSFSGAVTLDDASPTGSFSRTPGTITSDPLKTNNGTLIASAALDFVCFYDDATGALVLRKTGLSTDGSGVFTVTDAALQQGVTYRVDWQVSTGQRRMPRRAAT